MLYRTLSNLFSMFVSLFVMLIMMIFEPVFQYLVGGGTRLKTCTLPTLWAFIIELSKKYNTMIERLSGRIFLDILSAGHKLNKIYDRSSGNRPLSIIGLPYQAGALLSPSGL